MICQYCKQPARFVDNAEIYNGTRYGKSYMMWFCKPCDAYVGTHNNDPNRPLGELSNKELREWRKKAHRIIDSYWKSGKMKRSWVYYRLAKHFGEETHVGWSDVKMCKKIVAIAPTISCRAFYFVVEYMNHQALVKSNIHAHLLLTRGNWALN